MILKYIIILLFSFNYCYSKDFSSYQIYEVPLEGLGNNEDGFFDSLNISLDEEIEIIHEDPIKGGLQVLVSPIKKDVFLSALKDKNIGHKIIAEDVGRLIERTYNFRSEVLNLKGESTFERYMTFEEIKSFLKMISMKFPHKITVKNIGRSLEGEDIPMIAITENIRRKKSRNKPVIFIEAGAHAREWISVSTAVFLIERLARSSTYTVDTEWRIIPVLNPDGYKYSWKENRIWRKNRRTFADTNCTGVDLNRNFDSYWSKAGSSSRKCASTFPGESPFSEPETKAMRDAVMEVQKRTKAFVSFHNYGQLILYPPGSNFHKMSIEKDATLEILGKKMSEGIFNSTQTKYYVGSPSKILYPASGLSMDWAMLEAGIPLSYTFELRDEGFGGFLLPEGEIQITVEEVWAAMKILYHESNKIKLSKDSVKINQKQASTTDNAYQVDEGDANEIKIPLFFLQSSLFEKLKNSSKNFMNESNTSTTTIQTNAILLYNGGQEENNIEGINTSTENPVVTTT